ncbi:hypothetical protein [Mesorhizobium sp. M1E.F.Ca.ET.041.01.1.1]|uniref:hypothetical protein n=1 Tax=Mesorhizobium sp. M1E.F.Ca.ET.041.01.1.1 TaxID=2496759 RepID=UPI000FCC110E|nr:hypothetical protein [Mesorhizobium sp. M1E.F.Ca.ET.041.01.1.1]RUW19603.1 hypothetical protein EOA38_34320 [Mesorhizobium sp. M1E.F.Ca.ET.041.01.1.1]RWD92520.1 MAG: hypothetical protein EOS38_01430 [Mesorhizobium sp.]
MTMSAEIYAERRRRRAAHMPGATPTSNEPEAPAPAADAFGRLLVNALISEGAGKTSMLNTAAIYAKRRARRASWLPGAAEEE